MTLVYQTAQLGIAAVPFTNQMALSRLLSYSVSISSCRAVMVMLVLMVLKTEVFISWNLWVAL